MSSGCLTENEVQALLEGALATARLERIETHLDACLKCQLLVSAGVRTTSLRTHGFDRGAPARVHFETGEVVAARYRITRFIARGGMGEVYAAYDEMLGEEIGLKVLLRPESDGPGALTRLKAEVQLARRVSDPHVLRVFDIGAYRTPKGGEILFLTMQLLEGETLGERIRRAGPLAPAEVWRLAGDLFAALGAAHRVGIVHRDFKSDNVMLVAAAAGPPQAVVMDFGLAQVATDARASEHGAPLIAGTIGYMAPEQLSGGRVTAAADVYAFGVVLHEMLTGVLPPFRPRLGRRAADLPAPPLVRLEALDVPTRWSSLIRRCLARDPALRFRNILEAHQTVAGAGGVGRRVALTAATVASLAVAAIVVTLSGRSPASTATRPAAVVSTPMRMAPLAAGREVIERAAVVTPAPPPPEPVPARKPRPPSPRRHREGALAAAKPEPPSPADRNAPGRAVSPTPVITDDDQAIDPFRGPPFRGPP